MKNLSPLNLIVKSLNKILYFSLLAVFASCSGQIKTTVPRDTVASKPAPIVVKTFTSVGLHPDFDTTLVSQYIRSIFQDSKGNLWFGTLGEGVVRYDVKSLTYFSKNEGLTANSVHAINEDKNGNIWVGTDQGVFRYDATRFKQYNKANGLTNLNVSRKGILVDKSGTIWVGTTGGIFRYIPSADSTDGQCFLLFDLLPNVTVNDMLEDNTGNIWFVSEDKGVFRFDGKTITDITDKQGLGNNYAGGMVQDNAGNFWFTMKGGICRYDGKTFTEFTTKDGLGGSEVWGIYAEKSGIIWITARGSTTRFNPAVIGPSATAFTVFTEMDGINCCVQSMYQDKSGNMWWGAGSGLYRFDGNRFYKVKRKGPW